MDIGSLIALSTAALVVFSVLYDWAYFTVFDFRIINVLTISDHIKSVVQRAPFFIGISIGVLASLYPKNPKGRVELDEKDAPLIRLPDGSVLAWSPHSWWLIILWFVVFLIDVLRGDYFGLAMYIFLLFLCLRLISPVLQRVFLWNLVGLTLAIYVAAFLAIGAVGWGFMSAWSDLKHRSGAHTMELKDGTVREQILLVRGAEQGAIIRDTRSQEILFVPWANVVQLTRHRKVRRPNLICRYLNVLCHDYSDSNL